MSAGLLHRLAAIGATTGLVIALAAGTGMAAALPGMVKAIPDPPGAPQLNEFLVTLPHPHATPTRVVFRFTSQSGVTTSVAEPLKYHDKYQYLTTWKAIQQGRVSVKVYARNHQLLAEGDYQVAKSKVNPDGRIIVGALFIGASLWFWWRQRRLYRNYT